MSTEERRVINENNVIVINDDTVTIDRNEMVNSQRRSNNRVMETDDIDVFNVLNEINRNENRNNNRNENENTINGNNEINHEQTDDNNEIRRFNTPERREFHNH